MRVAAASDLALAVAQALGSYAQWTAIAAIGCVGLLVTERLLVVWMALRGSAPSERAAIIRAVATLPRLTLLPRRSVVTTSTIPATDQSGGATAAQPADPAGSLVVLSTRAQSEGAGSGDAPQAT